MTNVELIAAHIAKHGGKNMLIHSIPDTPLWLVMEKVASDQWIATLLNPMRSGRHRLGVMSNAAHLRLWMELVQLEIERRIERNALRATRDPPS